MNSQHTHSSLLKQYLTLSNHFEQDDLFKKLLRVIKVQEDLINDLKAKNRYYRDIEINLKHNLSEYEELKFEQSDEPMSLDTRVNLDNLYFVTITFDPHRFDNLELTTELSQKRYIIKQLHELRHNYYFVYGCFEKHKSGIIHSHLIMEALDDEIIRDRLTRAFSSKLNNKHAIDMSPIRQIDNILRYIDTEIDRTGKLDEQKKKYGFYKMENFGLGKNL